MDTVIENNTKASSFAWTIAGNADSDKKSQIPIKYLDPNSSSAMAIKRQMASNLARTEDQKLTEEQFFKEMEAYVAKKRSSATRQLRT